MAGGEGGTRLTRREGCCAFGKCLCSGGSTGREVVLGFASLKPLQKGAGGCQKSEDWIEVEFGSKFLSPLPSTIVTGNTCPKGSYCKLGTNWEIFTGFQLATCNLHLAPCADSCSSLVVESIPTASDGFFPPRPTTNSTFRQSHRHLPRLRGRVN